MKKVPLSSIPPEVIDKFIKDRVGSTKDTCTIPDDLNGNINRCVQCILSKTIEGKPFENKGIPACIPFTNIVKQFSLKSKLELLK